MSETYRWALRFIWSRDLRTGTEFNDVDSQPEVQLLCLLAEIAKANEEFTKMQDSAALDIARIEGENTFYVRRELSPICGQGVVAVKSPILVKVPK